MVRPVLRAVLFLLSILAATAFTISAARLVAGPRGLDPVEGATFEYAQRIAQGRMPYLEPARPDQPSVMPVFPLAVSVLMRELDPQPFVPRARALLATLLVAALVMAIVRLETSSWTLAAAGAGFALMGSGLLAGPPGEARSETLMLLLATLGFLVLRLTSGAWGALAAAVLFPAAYFTDQQAGWFMAAAGFALALDSRKRLVAFTLMAGSLTAAGYVAFSQALGPWFNFSAWDAPFAAMRFDATVLLQYVGDPLLGKLGPVTLAAVLSFALPTPPWRGKGGLWMCMTLAALAAGMVSTQSAGFGPHSLIPIIVVLSIAGPISMQRVTRHLSAWPGSSRLGGQGVVIAALTLQFIVLLSCALPIR